MLSQADSGSKKLSALPAKHKYNLPKDKLGYMFQEIKEEGLLSCDSNSRRDEVPASGPKIHPGQATKEKVEKQTENEIKSIANRIKLLEKCQSCPKIEYALQLKAL